ncbi:MAG TPA: response regulator [Mucilaginibacter sp.]
METILVQERDENALEMISLALQREGYKVCGLADANENVLEMIGRYHPKLVLLDCWLNHYSGRRIAQWIKAHFPALPLVALGGDIEVSEHYRELGFNGCLTKPFDLTLLHRVLHKNIHRRKRTAWRPTLA